MKLIIIRLGEIWLKSKPVKSALVKKLTANIKSILPKAHKIYYQNNRLYLKTKITSSLLDKLSKIPGITSLSPALQIPNDLITLEKETLSLAKKILNSKTSFALNITRTKTYPISSLKIAEILGKKVQKATKSPVNLSSPDISIHLEIQDNSAFLFQQKIPGLGGLPVGSQGKIISLISGGIDSPVATVLLLKRGCSVTPLHFNSYPFVEKSSSKKTKQILRYLKNFSSGSSFSPIIFPYEKTLIFIKNKFPKKFHCIFCKRAMIKIANLYASEKNAQAIATGENLGQVASQTLSNLKTINQASSLPILRPLLGFDKQEIISLSKKFALFNLSIQKPTTCKAVPSKPATKSDISKILALEKKFRFDHFLKEQLEKLK